MNCNTQNAKIASITEKTLIVGIDVGSYARKKRAVFYRTLYELLLLWGDFYLRRLCSRHSI
jgi:hypothetical protein